MTCPDNSSSGSTGVSSYTAVPPLYLRGAWMQASQSGLKQRPFASGSAVSPPSTMDGTPLPFFFISCAIERPPLPFASRIKPDKAWQPPPPGP